MFGIGADIDDAAWRTVFRQLVAHGFLAGRPRSIRRAEARRKQPRGAARRSLAWRCATRASREHRGRRSCRGDALALDADRASMLFERLRSWRGNEARTQGVPAYVILHDRTLAAIAQARPAITAALGRIDGIGTCQAGPLRGCAARPGGDNPRAEGLHAGRADAATPPASHCHLAARPLRIAASCPHTGAGTTCRCNADSRCLRPPSQTQPGGSVRTMLPTADR